MIGRLIAMAILLVMMVLMYHWMVGDETPEKALEQDTTTQTPHINPLDAMEYAQQAQKRANDANRRAMEAMRQLEDPSFHPGQDAPSSGPSATEKLLASITVPDALEGKDIPEVIAYLNDLLAKRNYLLIKPIYRERIKSETFLYDPQGDKLTLQQKGETRFYALHPGTTNELLVVKVDQLQKGIPVYYVEIAHAELYKAIRHSSTPSSVSESLAIYRLYLTSKEQCDQAAGALKRLKELGARNATTQPAKK